MSFILNSGAEHRCYDSFYGVGHVALVFPGGCEFDKVVRAMIGITMFQSAYTAEAVRGGLAAIPKGQAEQRWHLAWVMEKNNLHHTSPGVEDIHSVNRKYLYRVI